MGLSDRARTQGRGLRTPLTEPERIEEFVDALPRRSVILIEQVSPLAQTVSSWLSPRLAQVIQFPHVESQAIYPHLCIGSGWQAMSQPDLQRRLWRRMQVDIASIEIAIGRMSKPHIVAALIQGSFQTERLFHSFNHPCATVFTSLFGPVLDELVDAGLIALGAAQRILHHIEVDNGISFLSDHPLHPRVADALELDWARDGWYGLWSESTALCGTGAFAKGREAVERALAMPGCDPRALYSLALIAEVLGDMETRNDAFFKLLCNFPENPVYRDRWVQAAASAPT